MKRGYPVDRKSTLRTIPQVDGSAVAVLPGNLKSTLDTHPDELERMKKLTKRLMILGMLSVGTFAGCRQESREYLRALESKDRLIERDHKARRDLIDSMSHRSLSGFDRALESELRVQQDVLMVDSLLDSHRPHKPDPVLFNHASQLVRTLEEQLAELKEQWADASKGDDPDHAKALSAKIRDSELALAEASETQKRSQPEIASMTIQSDSVNSKSLSDVKVR